MWLTPVVEEEEETGEVAHTCEGRGGGGGGNSQVECLMPVEEEEKEIAGQGGSCL